MGGGGGGVVVNARSESCPGGVAIHRSASPQSSLFS